MVIHGHSEAPVPLPALPQMEEPGHLQRRGAVERSRGAQTRTWFCSVPGTWSSLLHPPKSDSLSGKGVRVLTLQSGCAIHERDRGHARPDA